MGKRVLITGGAGFIGSSLADSLLLDPEMHITCLDNFDNFYDASLKFGYIRSARVSNRYVLIEGDICDSLTYSDRLKDKHFDMIIHLAAKAGVRPSILQPDLYYETNVRGTHKLLEFARERGIKKFIFASSSSVYGINPKVPWSELDTDFKPISPYASTKISAEMLGHVYAHLYNIQFIALRFFSVYGERQRPDLAIHKFVRAIEQHLPIPFFGDGRISRDYTYIGDIVQGIIAAMDYECSLFEVINLGNGKAVSLMDMVRCLGDVMQEEVLIDYLPEQAGDVPQTFADISKAKQLLGYEPMVDLTMGLGKFVAWWREECAE